MAAKKEEKQLVPAQEAGQLALADYADDAGRGYENETSWDIVPPFISLLQALSPQVTAEDSPYKAGQLFNSITEEAVPGKEGLLFVVGAVQHVVVEWIPRDNGGGLVAVHPTDYAPYLRAKKETGLDFGAFSTAYDKDGKAVGNDLIETYYLYGMVCNDSDPEYMAVFSLKSTYITPWKKYNTRVRTFVPKGPDGKVLLKDGKPIRIPRFAHLIRVTSVQEQRTKGTSYNFVFSPADGTVANSLLARNDPRYQAARECLELFEKGRAKAAIDSERSSEAVEDDKVPF